MKLKKSKILTVVLLLILTLNLTSCAECISTEYEDVEVVVTDEYYSSEWVQPVCAGKVVTVIVHPAIYEITVEYNGKEYILDDSDIYDEYKDKIGQAATGQLKIKTYDNGDVIYDIVSLER